MLTAVDLVQRGIESKSMDFLFQYRLSVNFLLRSHLQFSLSVTLKGPGTVRTDQAGAARSRLCDKQKTAKSSRSNRGKKLMGGQPMQLRSGLIAPSHEGPQSLWIQPVSRDRYKLASGPCCDSRFFAQVGVPEHIGLTSHLLNVTSIAFHVADH